MYKEYSGIVIHYAINLNICLRPGLSLKSRSGFEGITLEHEIHMYPIIIIWRFHELMEYIVFERSF